MEKKEILRPSYYIGKSGRDVFDVAYDFGLDALRFNAFKYIVWAGKRNPGKFSEDIDKAIECLRRSKEIECLRRLEEMTEVATKNECKSREEKLQRDDSHPRD